MKRKIISIILTTAILLTLFPLFGIVTASAVELDNFNTVWANAVEPGARVSGISDSAASDRKVYKNALDAPDAYDYTDVLSTIDNKKIAAARYYDSATYYFGEMNGLPETIYNNPDNVPFFDNQIDGVAEQLGVAGYDLCLFEATVGGWHPEAVEITLLNAVVGDEIIPEYTIGVAFNNVGNMLLSVGYIEGEIGIEGFAQKNANIGNLSATFVWFPDDVLKADGVKLIDRTAEYNQKVYTHNGKTKFTIDGIQYKASYLAKLDGFDLDAIGAWTAEEIVIPHGAISAIKFNDLNEDGLRDDGEDVLEGFEFQLLKDDGTGEYVAILPLDADDDLDGDGVSDQSFATSDDNGDVDFGEWESGLYRIDEINIKDGWKQTSYLDGIYVEVDGAFVMYGDAPGNYFSSEKLEVGNVEESSYTWGKSKTTWGGWLTSILESNNGKYDDVVLTGKSDWSMAVSFTKELTDKTVDLIHDKSIDVGDAIITDNGDGTITVALEVDPDMAKLTVVHIGVYSEIKKIPNGNGQYPVNIEYDEDEDIFTYTCTFDKVNADKNGKGGIAYTSDMSVIVSIHTETSLRIPG